MNGAFLTCETRQGLMDIYISAPSNVPKAPVVIVLQEAFGVNNHIRNVCDRLAKEGFLAAAPELYHRIGKRIEIPYEDRMAIMPALSQMTNEEIIFDIRETINFLENLPSADTRNVATLGFCVGGFSSVLAATKIGIQKMISFYGAGTIYPRPGIALRPFPESYKLIKARCLFFFGGKDASISHDEIHEIEKLLTGAKVPFEVSLFEGSDHGFFCDERKSYCETDAKVAWEKTLSFLKIE